MSQIVACTVPARRGTWALPTKYANVRRFESKAYLTLNKLEIMERFNASPQPCIITLGNGRMIDAHPENFRITIEFTSTDEHCHSGRIVQGGFVAGMLDNAMSVAAMCSADFEEAPATLELKTTYIKSASQGINRASGWVVKRGRDVVFLEGELRNADGDLLATATSTALMVNPLQKLA